MAFIIVLSFWGAGKNRKENAIAGNNIALRLLV
jgi:hypothetical protein